MRRDVFAAAPGVEIAVLRQGQHEMAAAAQLLDLDAIVVEVVHHHGRRLVLLVSVAQCARIEHGASRTPGEHVALVAESGRVVVAADDLLDREPLQRGNQRWVIHLGMSAEESGNIVAVAQTALVGAILSPRIHVSVLYSKGENGVLPVATAQCSLPTARERIGWSKSSTGLGRRLSLLLKCSPSPLIELPHP